MRLSVVTFLLLSLTPQARGQVLDKCQAAKIKAAGKATYATAKCHATALKDGTSLDPLCLTKAEAKFAKAMATADTLGSDLTPGCLQYDQPPASAWYALHRLEFHGRQGMAGVRGRALDGAASVG